MADRKGYILNIVISYMTITQLPSRHNCLVIMMSSAIDCDIISRTKTERVRHGNYVKRLSFLLSFMDSLCRAKNIIMYVPSWWTVPALTRVLFRCSFSLLLRNSGNKHQNNLLVSADTVRHLSTHIILYICNQHDKLAMEGSYTDILLNINHKSH